MQVARRADEGSYLQDIQADNAIIVMLTTADTKSPTTVLGSRMARLFPSLERRV